MENNKIIDEDSQGVYVVIPTYNDETTVSQVIEEIAKRGYHIVLVNDGSSDKTLENAKKSQQKYPNQIIIVSHIINRWLGSALNIVIED